MRHVNESLVLSLRIILATVCVRGGKIEVISGGGKENKYIVFHLAGNNRLFLKLPEKNRLFYPKNNLLGSLMTQKKCTV